MDGARLQTAAERVDVVAGDEPVLRGEAVEEEEAAERGEDVPEPVGPDLVAPLLVLAGDAVEGEGDVGGDGESGGDGDGAAQGVGARTARGRRRWEARKGAGRARRERKRE